MINPFHLTRLQNWCTILIATCIWLTTPVDLPAQQDNFWKIQHIGVEQGLSNRFVNSVIQDSLGFTWIATNFGLNRYDGQHMDVLTRETFHISTNSIFKLYLDVHQKLWLIHRDVGSAPITAIDVLDPISFKVQSIREYIQVIFHSH
jgi:ligand-binding sensor domain-containing protein